MATNGSNGSGDSIVTNKLIASIISSLLIGGIAWVCVTLISVSNDLAVVKENIQSVNEIKLRLRSMELESSIFRSRYEDLIKRFDKLEEKLSK